VNNINAFAGVITLLVMVMFDCLPRFALRDDGVPQPLESPVLLMKRWRRDDVGEVPPGNAASL